MIKLVIFDFDGTLADTKKMLLKLIENNLDKLNYKLNKRFIREFGDRPLGDALKLINLEEKVLPFFRDEIEKDFEEWAEKTKPAKNLRKLKEIKKKKIIISNSIGRFVRIALRKMHADFFDGVRGSENFETKYEYFKKLIISRSIKPREVVYVGDRPIDAELAKRIGCISVLVSGKAAWSSKKEQIKAKPDYIIDDLGKLKKLIEELDSIS